MEMQETVAAVLERLPDLHLDASAPLPKLAGFQLREFYPLKALFAPGKVRG